ncbi:hypothetical protein NM688_g6642 [Phlebia brevispora]|uniref:Uncharacterized protein n=1 Tax=Phlebia brevispora TaxID=194682 RepID=A0ACC1SE65_9APHY|nr:hypothetical protein NM688_g6642 [Phlebia brevispora]
MSTSPRTRRRVTGLFNRRTADATSGYTALRAPYPNPPPTSDNVSSITLQSLRRDGAVETPDAAGKQVTTNTKEEWASKMPESWRTPEKPLQKMIHFVLCVGALGQYSMALLWEACGDDELFRQRKERMMDRLSNISVVAGLLLAALAAFLSTTPPLPNILNYNLRVTYLFMCHAFAATIAVTIVSSAILYALTEARRDWFVDSLGKSRAKVHWFLVLVGFPFWQIAFAMGSTVLGLLIAAWTSHDRFMQIGAIVDLVVPLSLGPLYLWSLRYTHRQNEPSPSASSGAGTPSNGAESRSTAVEVEGDERPMEGSDAV